MDTTPRTIVIEPDSELVRALEDIEDAETTPIVLVRNGARFRVIREAGEHESTYDPETVRAALRAVAGTLTAEEGERLKEIIYRGREEGTRPIDRP